MLLSLLNDKGINQIVNEFVKIDLFLYTDNISYSYHDILPLNFQIDEEIYSKTGDGSFIKFKLMVRLALAFGYENECDIDVKTGEGNIHLNNIKTIDDICEMISLKLHGI